MKKHTLIYALLFMFVLVSCQKDEITVFLKESGTVSIKVVDENDRPMKDCLVTINGKGTNYDYGNLPLYYSGTTDEEGMFYSESLLQGEYYCYATTKAGKVIYQDRKLIQIISGENKTVILSPLKNVGKMTIQLVNFRQEPLSISGVNIALVSYELAEYRFTLSKLLSVAHFTATTNNGQVQFEKLPTTSSYYIYIYDTKKEYVYPMSDRSYSVSSDEDLVINLQYDNGEN